MKYYISIIILLSSIKLYAQSVKGRDIDCIIKIDSLFSYYDYAFPFEFKWIKRDKNELTIKHKVAVYDSTRQVQNSFKEVVDTINLENMNDSLFILPLFKKYNLEIDESRYFINLLRLIRDNDIRAIEFAGPGDWLYCSRLIFITKSTAFFIRDINELCYSDSNNWTPRKSNSRKIKNNIYLVRNIRSYY